MTDKPAGGAQPFSFRVPWLRKLATGGNVVLAWGARYLLDDRPSRRFGIVFESLVVYGFSVTAILLLYSVRDLAGLDRNSWEYYDLYSRLWPTIFGYLGLFFCLQILAIVTGTLTAVRPVNAIIHYPDRDLKSRLKNEHPDMVFNSLATLQMFSIGIPVAVGLVVMTVAAFLLLSPGTEPGSTSDQFGFSWIQALVGLILQFMWLMFLCFGSIFAGTRYRTMWTSFWFYILIIAIFVFSLLLIFVGLFFLTYSNPDRSAFVDLRDTLLVVWGFVGVYVLYLLARNEVRSKLSSSSEETSS